MPFAEALAHTLREEGGFVHHPHDPGGATNKGITQKVYNVYRRSAGLPTQSVRAITEPEIFAIYKNNYWVGSGRWAPKCDELDSIDPRIALAHFDCAVNSGGYRANAILQKAVEASPDSIIGPITLERVRSKKPDDVVRAMIEEREEFMWDLVMQRPETYRYFLRGWMLRIRRLRRAVGVY